MRLVWLPCAHPHPPPTHPLLGSASLALDLLILGYRPVKLLGTRIRPHAAAHPYNPYIQQRILAAESLLPLDGSVCSGFCHCARSRSASNERCAASGGGHERRSGGQRRLRIVFTLLISSFETQVSYDTLASERVCVCGARAPVCGVCARVMPLYGRLSPVRISLCMHVCVCLCVHKSVSLVLSSVSILKFIRLQSNYSLIR